jgi:hypothetical protein
MFRHGANGFRLVFDNGYAISVQWGPSSYADNTGDGTSETAEIAVFRPNGSMMKLASHSTVNGWQTAENVAQYIAIVSGPNPENAGELRTW